AEVERGDLVAVRDERRPLRGVGDRGHRVLSLRRAPPPAGRRRVCPRGGPGSGVRCRPRPGWTTNPGGPVAQELDGIQVAFLVATEGVEQIELVGPWEAIRAVGGTPHLVATEKGKVQAMHHLDRGDVFE